MCGEITDPNTSFNGATGEVLEWISNLIPQFTGHVITAGIKVKPCWN